MAIITMEIMAMAIMEQIQIKVDIDYLPLQSTKKTA